MRIAFVDETVVKDKYFILTMLSMSEEALKIATVQLNKIKSDYSLPPRVEIKWNRNDFNRQLEKNGLESFDESTHREIKSKVSNFICSFDSNDIKLFWYLSPYSFFKYRKWRSYQYAMNDVFDIYSDYLNDNSENSVILIDELSNAVAKKDEKRGLLEDYIHTLKAGGRYSNLIIIVPTVNSNVSMGHQLNDISSGLLNNYISALHDEDKQPSDSVTNALKEICVYLHRKLLLNKEWVLNYGLHIKPMLPRQKDLQEMNRITRNSFKKDLGI